eukprot:g13372.t1
MEKVALRFEESFWEQMAPNVHCIYRMPTQEARRAPTALEASFCVSLKHVTGSNVLVVYYVTDTARHMATLEEEKLVPQLRAKLRDLGLDDQGIRKTLVERLLAAGRGLESSVAVSLQAPAVQFIVNASVGRMARVVGVRAGQLWVLGDFTGRSSGLDPLSGKLLSQSLTLLSCPVLIWCCVQAVGLAMFQPSPERDADVGEYARVAWSPASNLAIYAGGGRVHKVAGVDSGGSLRYCVDAGIGAVWSLCSSGSRVVCGGSWSRPEHTARVASLDAESGEVLFSSDPGVGRYIVTALSRDGGVAFCGGENGMVTALDSATGEVRFRAESSVEEVWHLEVTEELLLCSGGWSELMSALDLQGQHRWGPMNATVGKIFSLLQLPHDDLLLCGGSNSRVAGLQLSSGQLRFSVDLPDVGEIWSMAYDPSSRLLFCGGNKELTGVFKAETNIKVRLAADINAPTLAGAESKKLKSGEWVSVIKAGEFFQASELKQKDGQTYLKLADQDGWVFGKGIAGEWRGKDIVVPVAEADVINAKAKIVANTMERQLIRDDSDKFALYVIGAALLLVAVERIWEELNQ